MDEPLNTETLIGNTIATPVAPIVELDGLDKPREVLAIINDANVGEPFTLYKGSAGAWWMKEDGVKKVEQLIWCFKNDMSVEEACFSIGILRTSYYYFIKVHPEFFDIKQQLSQAFPAVAKLTLGQGLTKDPSLALRYLQGAQPETYRRSVLPDLPQGGSMARRSEEVWRDSEGKVTVSRKMAEYIEQHGTGENDNG